MTSTIRTYLALGQPDFAQAEADAVAQLVLAGQAVDVRRIGRAIRADRLRASES